MQIYDFDFSDYKMLCDRKDSGQYSIMQINSPENYFCYHLVSLFEKMEASPDALPLKTLILGCTHYPLLIEEIQKFLVELRNPKVDGKYRYPKLFSKNVKLIDPSVFTAQEVYNYLNQEKLLNELDKKSKLIFTSAFPI